MSNLERSPETEELMDQKDMLHDIKVLKESKGGQELIKLITQDVITSMRKLALSDKDPLSATLKANLDLLTLLMNAKENEEAVDQMIEEALNA